MLFASCTVTESSRCSRVILDRVVCYRGWMSTTSGVVSACSVMSFSEEMFKHTRS